MYQIEHQLSEGERLKLRAYALRCSEATRGMPLQAAAENLASCAPAEEDPDWLHSLHADVCKASASCDCEFDPLGHFESDVITAFEGMNYIIDPERPLPGWERVISEGYDPSAKHLEWLRSLVQEFEEARSANPNTFEPELFKFVSVCRDCRVNVSYPQYVKILDSRTGVWQNCPYRDFMSHYRVWESKLADEEQSSALNAKLCRLTRLYMESEPADDKVVAAVIDHLSIHPYFKDELATRIGSIVTSERAMRPLDDGQLTL